MHPVPQLRLIAVPGLPLVAAGDDLASLVAGCLAGAGLALERGDIVVFAQKIVSKSEGRLVYLDAIAPSADAQRLAPLVNKDARLVELILRESVRVVRAAKDVLIVEHKLGFVMANAGIDQSNVASPDGNEAALLLPLDPDASAERLRERLMQRCGHDVAVIISDSFGRAWRVGTVGVAIGAAGFESTFDLRGSADMYGRTLRSTVVGHGDEVAAAASLVMGQSTERVPVVLVRGLPQRSRHAPARELLRPSAQDLFR